MTIIPVQVFFSEKDSCEMDIALARAKSCTINGRTSRKKDLERERNRGEGFLGLGVSRGNLRCELIIK